MNPALRRGAPMVRTGQQGVVISDAQRRVHVTFEAAAVVIAAPFSFWLATQKSLPDWARGLSFAIGAATLVVDGGLLLSYLKKERERRA